MDCRSRASPRCECWIRTSTPERLAEERRRNADEERPDTARRRTGGHARLVVAERRARTTTRQAELGAGEARRAARRRPRRHRGVRARPGGREGRRLQPPDHAQMPNMCFHFLTPRYRFDVTKPPPRLREAGRPVAARRAGVGVHRAAADAALKGAKYGSFPRRATTPTAVRAQRWSRRRADAPRSGASFTFWHPLITMHVCFVTRTRTGLRQHQSVVAPSRATDRTACGKREGPPAPSSRRRGRDSNPRPSL